MSKMIRMTCTKIWVRESALVKTRKTPSMDDDVQKWKLAFMDTGAIWRGHT
jgi:hypothetical protein